MRKLFQINLIILVSFIFFSCSQSDNKYYVDEIIFHKGFFYKKLIHKYITKLILYNIGEGGLVFNNNRFKVNGLVYEMIGDKELLLGQMKDGLKDKVWNQYYDNGNMEFEVTFVNGKENGLLTCWYESGEIDNTINYKNGVKNGLFNTWFKNGQKRHEGYFTNGEFDGLMTSWYENGQKESEKYIEDMEVNGQSTIWYKNGQLLFKGNYKDGYLDGKNIFWYENGQKSFEYEFNFGELILEKQWYENGQVKLKSSNDWENIYDMFEKISNIKKYRMLING
jgi:antitoxin component YwqK of YwqJK toxin-antitoxin module